MKLNSTKDFPFSMETGWKALHSPASLDVEPGSTVEVLSDTEWNTRAKGSDGRELSCNHYTASFDEAQHRVTIEINSDKKVNHDFIYLSLSEASGGVSLNVEMDIHTGVHLIARTLGNLFAKPMQEIIMRHIFHNFEALCSGKETKTMSQEELSSQAGHFFHGKE